MLKRVHNWPGASSSRHSGGVGIVAGGDFETIIFNFVLLRGNPTGLGNKYFDSTLSQTVKYRLFNPS